MTSGGCTYSIDEIDRCIVAVARCMVMNNDTEIAWALDHLLKIRKRAEERDDKLAQARSILAKHGVALPHIVDKKVRGR